MSSESEARPIAIVAEDDPMSRRVLCRMLETLGYDPIRAVDGVQAVKLAGRTEAAVIFMDLGMPHLDGLDALQAILAEPGQDGLRVVAVTGDVTDCTRRECARAGFNAFLPKPVEYDELRVLLGR